MFLDDITFDLEQYTNTSPATSISGVMIVNDTLANGNVGRVMSIPTGAGFGYTDVPTSKDWFMRVNHDIAYEVSFWFKQASTAASFRLALNAFSAYNVERPIYDSSTAHTLENEWIHDSDRVLGVVNEWNFARYVVYGYNQELISSHLTSLTAGRNLRMSKGTANVIVTLQCTLDTIKIYNFKFKPLMTPFSTGFIQGSDLMEIWRVNNSGKYSDEELDNISKNYLLAYNFSNTTIKLTT